MESNEPTHEIMALIALRKLNLQTRMRSNPLPLHVSFFCQTLRLLPYFMFTNSESSGETVQMFLIWFDFCFTALQHILGHFGRGHLT